VTNGPEGLLPIPGRDLFAVSSEVDVPEDDVRSAITLFKLGAGEPQFPSIRSADVNGSPLGWGALSALSADPRDRNRLWTVSDSYYSPTQLFVISVAKRPAVITSALTVTENGAPIGVDAEGLFARRSGGFWLAAEGATGPENEILRLDRNAAVLQRIPLPAEVAAGLGSNGLEGITAVGVGRWEQVYVALQRPLSTDPAGIARIGRYDVTKKVWTWYGYPLDTGSGVGLSELVAVDWNTFAVIERDNRPGTFAALKRVYTFDLPFYPKYDQPSGLSILTKRLAVDLLPDLSAGNGWVQEKVEGLTVGRDRQVYVVTDNDGVEDATGETVFLRLGSARTVFGR
jgi:Esterase-like activity of phytase